MELGNLRPESHMAQKSRRDKLRVVVVEQSSKSQLPWRQQQQQSEEEDYPSKCNLDQLSAAHDDQQQELNPDFIQVSNVSYGNFFPAMFSSEMLNYATASAAANPQVLLAHKDAHQEAPTGRPVFAGVISGGDPQNCDWMFNYSSGLAGSSSESTLNPPQCVGVSRPGFNGFQGRHHHHVVHSSTNLTHPWIEVSSPKHYEELPFGSSTPRGYHGPPLLAVEGLNNTHDGRLGWTVGGNELVLLPGYGGDSSNPAWMEEGCPQWSEKSIREVGRGILASSDDCINNNNNTQGLCLSLSPNLPPPTKAASLKSDYLCWNSNDRWRSSGSSKINNGESGKVGSSSCLSNRNTGGPLGPFTGYATILKGSKFLKPAQQLLDEICTPVVGSRSSSMASSDKVKGSTLAEADDQADAAYKGGGVSSSIQNYGSNEINGGLYDSSCGSGDQPYYQHNKAKLLFLHQEVCRRYKQYHQQMQMVVSSFESVPGLSATTPYISLALKIVLRHFRCLKNAISDQLKHIRKALGEDLFSPTTGASISKGDTASISKGDTASMSSRLKFVEHSFTNQFEPQQHVWRPPRGLPERAVAILRAWLFDHFLHPYPTDTDKHMLATQTGLSRNQVSNWFINARVRVWKPMVEEIHMLETKGGSAQANSNSNLAKYDDRIPAEGGSSRVDADSLMGFVSPSYDQGLRAVSLTLGLCQGAVSTAATTSAEAAFWRSDVQ